MTKKIFTAIMSLFMILSFSVISLAEDKAIYVSDEAYIINNDELEILNQKAERISLKYGCGVYIVVMEDYLSYPGISEFANIEDTAEKFYLDDYFLGLNDDKSGIMLMLSMAERDYILYAHGYGNIAFTDYGKDYLADSFLYHFRDDNWYLGFESYLDTCDEMLAAAFNGAPVDVGTVIISLRARIIGIAICFVLGFIIAYFIKKLLESRLSSVSEKHEAFNYTSKGGLNLTEQQDCFTHMTQARVYDPPVKQNTSGGSRGGTTTNSRGSSSKSGKF